MKKKLYGNYLGLVITGAESDPENRGRCQIFFPGVSNTLYKKINKNIKDLSFGHIDPSVLTPDIIQDLRTVLPWSECAAPIAGGGTSAFYNPVTNQTALGFQETINPDVQTPDLNPPDPPAWSTKNGDSSDVELPDQTFQSIQGNIGNISVDKKGNIDPVNFYNVMQQKIANSSLNGYIPLDGKDFGIDGSPASYARYFTMLQQQESTHNIYAVGDGGESYGPGQFKAGQYGLKTRSDVLDPNKVADAYINVAKTWVLPTSKGGQNGSGYIAGRAESGQKNYQGWRGMSSYFGPMRRPNEWSQHSNWFSTKVDPNFKPVQVAATDNSLPSPIPEPVDDAPSPASAFAGYSGRPHGVFSFPRMGAKLWAFFYGGDVQRPVYFAAAYEPDSIRYAIGASSPAAGLVLLAKQIDDSIELPQDSISLDNMPSLTEDSTSEYKWVDSNNQAGGGMRSGVEVSGTRSAIPYCKSFVDINNLEDAGLRLNGPTFELQTPGNSGGSIKGNEEGTLIDGGSSGDVVITAPNGKVKIVGDLEVTSGVSQKDQKAASDQLKKEQALVEQIANQQANDIAQGGEDVSCPVCDQKLADDRSDFVTKILRTIRKYSNILPWDCWNWGVTKFLINFIVIPMLNEISALAVSGGEGCGMCDKGKVKSYASAMENASKKAAETFSQKQNEINESAKNFKAGSNVQTVLGSYGIDAGGEHMNNAKCSKELKDDCGCIPTGMKKGTGAKANPLHLTGEKVPTVVYIIPNKTSAGDLFFRSANDIKMIAGSPGISMESNGKISITGGFLDLNSTDGPVVLTSKNVTNVNGDLVHITGAKGIGLTAPSVGVNGNLSVSGNLGVKGSITLDGALSVKHLKVKTMRSETTSNSSPKSTSNATTYYTGGAAGINIFDKIKNVLVRDNPLKMLMLTPKGLLTIFQEVYDRILLMIGIHPVPTGYFVGYGAGVVFNFTSNSSKVPDDHSHQFDAPQMTRAADNAAWVNMADDPSSEAPNPAPAQGDDPVGGPHSLAGCGGGGFGFSTGSNASRRRNARNSRYGVPINNLNYGKITPQGYFKGVTITTNNTILSGLSGGFITTTTDLSGNIITINNSITGNGLDIVYDFNPNSQKWEYDANGEIKPRDLVRFSISEDCL
jgi:hypothetical protein